MVEWKGFGLFFSTGIPNIVLLLLMIVTTLVIVGGLLCWHVKNKMNYTLWVLVVEYGFVVLCSTVICREEITCGFDRIQLTPFWTYMAVFNHTPGVSVWDIMLNIVLFLPLGLLIKLIYPSITFGKMIMIAFVCSLGIEVSQFLFCKGISQIDDVIHNTIGAAVGWGFAKISMTVSQRIMRNNREL